MTAKKQKVNTLESANPIPTPSPDSALEAIYEVIVGGEYYSMGEHGKTIKRYEILVKLPESCMPIALSVIKNKLLDKAIKVKYPDSLGFRTHEILNVVTHGDSALPEKISFMSRKSLIEYCSKNSLAIKFDLYREITELRHAVTDALRDYNTYRKQEDILSKKRKLDMTLNALNDSLFSAGDEL